MNSVTFIAGTSSGVGLSLTVLSAGQGHTVYATVHNLDKRAALETGLELTGMRSRPGASRTS